MHTCQLLQNPLWRSSHYSENYLRIVYLVHQSSMNKANAFERTTGYNADFSENSWTLTNKVTCTVRVGHAEKCQFAVSLWNVNFRTRSECQFVLTPRTGTQASLDMCITCDVGTFLGDGGRGGQGGWPFATYVFCGVKGINCWTQPTAANWEKRLFGQLCTNFDCFRENPLESTKIIELKD